MDIYLRLDKFLQYNINKYLDLVCYQYVFYGNRKKKKQMTILIVPFEYYIENYSSKDSKNELLFLK